MGGLRLSCFGVKRRTETMYTLNAIAPLLSSDISEEEARTVVESLTDEQKNIAVLALTKTFRETMMRIKELSPGDEIYWRLREILGG